MIQPDLQLHIGPLQGTDLAGDLEPIEDPARPTTPAYYLQGTDLADDLEQLEDPVRPTTLDYPLQGTDLAGDLEQLENPARPMTPGAEEWDDPDAGDAALYRQLFTDLL